MMEDYGTNLSKEELRIMQAAEEDMKKFERQISERLFAMDKSNFNSMDLNDKAKFYSIEMLKDHKVFSEMLEKANEYYALLKAEMDKGITTHQFITAEAMSLIGIPGKYPDLLNHCMDPDKDKELWELVYEGHFYGIVKEGKYGNFLPRVFKGPMLWFLEHLDNVKENALSNFCKNYTDAHANKASIKKLGHACHYLQDLTAPHHVANMAIFFELMTDGTSTHYAFEKIARDYVIKKGTGSFSKPALARLSQLEKQFSSSPLQPEPFGKEVYNQALANVDKIKKFALEKWQAAIDDAIPLAIGATALILKKWL
jgi:hypothetical protein